MSATPTVVPPGTRIEGRIECSGDLLLQGHCEGDLKIAGTLTVAAGGVCAATVRARIAEIHGEVIGNVICSERVQVAAGARVVGDIRGPDVSIDAEGAVDGTIDVLPPDPEAIPRSRTAARLSNGELVRPTPPQRTGVAP